LDAAEYEPRLEREAGPRIPQSFERQAEVVTICSRCKKPLSDPVSVRAGMGAICRGHAGAERGEGRDSGREFADEFDNEIPFGQALVLKRIPGRSDEDAEAGICVTNIPHLVVHHSPDGFEFGYGGSGPADLALNVCQLYLTLARYRGAQTKCYEGSCWTAAWALHQDFKREFISSMRRRGGDVPFEKIEAWFQKRMTDELIGACAEMIDEESTLLEG